MLNREPAPTGRARRGAKPPVSPIAAIDDPALPETLPTIGVERRPAPPDRTKAVEVECSVPGSGRLGLQVGVVAAGDFVLRLATCSYLLI